MDASMVLVALAALLVGAGIAVLVVRSTPHDDRGHDRPPAADPAVALQVDRIVDLLHGLAARDDERHGELSVTLRRTLEATSGLADATGDLRQALANSRARGQWGERMADDVLRAAGFAEGINYVRHERLANGEVPDVTFPLPGGRVLHMDVKFPLDNYLRAMAETRSTERRRHEVAFLRDVRNRIAEIGGRGYVEAGRTVDHVLVFIPNEAVYSFIHERDPAVVEVALRHRVVLCSPFTLYAVLGVIRQAVEAHDLTRTSDEILDVLAGFDDQWRRFTDKLDGLGRQVHTVVRSLEDLNGTRRRQLDRALERVDDLRSRRALDEDRPTELRPRSSPRAVS